jgi:hypothetical protein
MDHTGQAVAALTIPHLQRHQDPIGFDTCCSALFEATAHITRNLGGGIAHGVTESPV